MPAGGKNLLLTWWRKHEHKFPHFTKIANMISAVQATSVSSKQIFSKASLIITNKRTSLNSDIAGSGLYISKNYHWVRNQIFYNTTNYPLNNAQDISDDEDNYTIQSTNHIF